MRKKIMTLAISILVLLCMSISVNAEKNVNTLYKAFLSKQTVQIRNGNYYEIPLYGAYFTTVDIDHNGVDELIIKQGWGGLTPCHSDAHTFTIKNNKVVYVGSTVIKQDYSNTVRISPKYKSIYDCYGVASYTPTYFYTIKNCKFVSSKFFYAQYDYTVHENWCKQNGFYINKKKISKTKYNKIYNKYMKSLKTYTLVPNTYINRNKYLK